MNLNYLLYAPFTIAFNYSKTNIWLYLFLLGGLISNNIHGNHILRPNYSLILNKISDLSKVTVSWAGKIALTKMLLLPNIIYFFRTIPLPMLSSHLKTLQKQKTIIIWEQKKQQRIRNLLILIHLRQVYELQTSLNTIKLLS